MTDETTKESQEQPVKAPTKAELGERLLAAEKEIKELQEENERLIEESFADTEKANKLVGDSQQYIHDIINDCLAPYRIDTKHETMVDIQAAVDSLDSIRRDLMRSASGSGKYIGLIRGITQNILCSIIDNKVEALREKMNRMELAAIAALRDG